MRSRHASFDVPALDSDDEWLDEVEHLAGSVGQSELPCLLGRSEADLADLGSVSRGKELVEGLLDRGVDPMTKLLHFGSAQTGDTLSKLGPEIAFCIHDGETSA